MPQSTYRISGRVIDRETRRGVAGARVEAWDKDLVFDDLVGGAVTDAAGAFLIEFDESYFRECFLDRQPDLFFKVFRADELIHSTEDSVLWNLEVSETEILVEVEASVLNQPQPQRSVAIGEIRRRDSLGDRNLSGMSDQKHSLAKGG